MVLNMSQEISNIVSGLEHIKGQVYLLSQAASPELTIASKQFEKAIIDIEQQELVNLKKASDL